METHIHMYECVCYSIKINRVLILGSFQVTTFGKDSCSYLHIHQWITITTITLTTNFIFWNPSILFFYNKVPTYEYHLDIPVFFFLPSSLLFGVVRRWTVGCTHRMCDTNVGLSLSTSVKSFNIGVNLFIYVMV